MCLSVHCLWICGWDWCLCRSILVWVGNGKSWDQSWYLLDVKGNPLFLDVKGNPVLVQRQQSFYIYWCNLSVHVAMTQGLCSVKMKLSQMSWVECKQLAEGYISSFIYVLLNLGFVMVSMFHVGCIRSIFSSLFAHERVGKSWGCSGICNCCSHLWRFVL